MTALTVTSLTAQRIVLHLDNDTAANVGSVVRVDVNGTRSVRTQTGQLPSTAVSLDFYDEEYAPAPGVVAYTAYTAAGAVLASTSVTVPATPAAHVVYVACPLYPSNGFALSSGDLGPDTSFAISWDATRAARSTEHQVIGRADPVVVLRPGATRAGTLTLVCPTRLAAKLVEDQLSLPYVWLLRQSDVPGLDMYFTTGAVQARNIPDTTGPRFEVVVGFTEVNWPPGTFTPSNVWTWADVVAGYGDWNAVGATFATWATLLEKDPIL